MSLYWLLWLVVGFCVPEFYALLSGHAQWTLSEQVWKLEGLNDTDRTTFWNPMTWSIPHFLVVCFMIWLLVHFAEHAWRQM